MKVPLTELDGRMKRFRTRMDHTCPEWDLAAISGKIPLYYFTGTMQDGLLLIPQDAEAVFWVRQSFERAQDESLFPGLRKMKSLPGCCDGHGQTSVNCLAGSGSDANRPAPADAEIPAIH